MSEFLQESDDSGTDGGRRKRSRKGALVGRETSPFAEDLSGGEGRDRPKLRVMVHEIKIRNQVMFLDPPIEEARMGWFDELHEWLGEFWVFGNLRVVYGD